MKPVPFPEQTTVLAEHQKEYLPLPVHRTPEGLVVSCWRASWWQRLKLLVTGRVWVLTLTFGELRAFRKAVLTNAQLAASLTALLESNLPANNDPDLNAEGDENEAGQLVKAFARSPITRGMMVTLPSGFKAYGFDPKQPQTTYEMFCTVCLGEAVRPLSYPLNLALGTSQRFNFSSAKLDHINYRNSLTVERGDCAKVVLERIFRAWFEEAVLCGAIPVGNGLTAPAHEWHWPGYESIDPLVDAQTYAQQIAAGTLTLREFWARRGQDWKDVLVQLKAEASEIARLGLQFGDPVKRSMTDVSTETHEADEVPANAA